MGGINRRCEGSFSGLLSAFIGDKDARKESSKEMHNLTRTSFNTYTEGGFTKALCEAGG